MANLDLYNRVKQPPKEALKDFDNGKFKGTDINPMWRILKLTEEFGVCGFGWYTKVNRMWTEAASDSSNIAVFCELELYVKIDGEWSKPIVGVGGNTFERKTKNGSSVSDEAYKMAYTDALGIACKALGFGADVWWKYETTKYTANTTPIEQSELNAPICSDCGSVIAPSKTRTSQQMAQASKAKFGRVLCVTCANEEATRMEVVS